MNNEFINTKLHNVLLEMFSRKICTSGAVNVNNDLHTNFYYTMSLVGEQIHRLMSNSRKNCARTEGLMLASIPSGHITMLTGTLSHCSWATCWS